MFTLKSPLLYGLPLGILARSFVCHNLRINQPLLLKSLSLTFALLLASCFLGRNFLSIVLYTLLTLQSLTLGSEFGSFLFCQSPSFQSGLQLALMFELLSVEPVCIDMNHAPRQQLLPLTFLTRCLLGHPHKVLDIGLRWLRRLLGSLTLRRCIFKGSLFLGLGFFSLLLENGGLLRCLTLYFFLFLGKPGSLLGCKSLGLCLFSKALFNCSLLSCNSSGLSFLSLAFLNRSLLSR